MFDIGLGVLAIESTQPAANSRALSQGSALGFGQNVFENRLPGKNDLRQLSPGNFQIG
jgi:hypothetical protein